MRLTLKQEIKEFFKESINHPNRRKSVPPNIGKEGIFPDQT
jgi:hypothetical protein